MINIALFTCYIGYAQTNTPIVYEFDVYLDNIKIGDNNGLNPNSMPAVLYDHYYKDFFDNNPKWLKKKIRDSYMKKSDLSSIGDNRLYFITKRAKNGYLKINSQLNNFLMQLNNLPSIIYVIESNTVISSKNVKQLMRLSDKNIKKIDFIFLDMNRLEVRISLNQ